MARLRRPLLLLLAILLLAPGAAARGKNLIDNGGFDQTGDDPVPWWKIRVRPERTTVTADGGVLRMARKGSDGITADTVFQTVNLPPKTAAVGLRVKAAWAGVENGEVALTFVAIDGRPIGTKVVFRLRGDERGRILERDLLLPPGTRDVTVSLVLRARGSLEVDDVELRALDAEEVRPEARVIAIEGTVSVTANADGEWVVPIPPPTAEQAPLRFEAAVEPPGRIAAATVIAEDGDARLVLTPAETGPRTADVTFRAIVLVTDRADLPEEIEVTPVRHLARRYAPYAEGPESRALDDWASKLPESKKMTALARASIDVVRRFVPEVAGGESDPAKAAGARKGSGAGRAAVLAALLRRRDVPARVVALVPVGTAGPEYGVETFARDLGWVRFHLDPEEPAPSPTGRFVLLAAAGPDGFPDPAAGARTTAEELGSFVLPRGGGADVAEALANAFQKAARAPAIEDRKVSVRFGVGAVGGKAKRLRDELLPILGD